MLLPPRLRGLTEPLAQLAIAGEPAQRLHQRMLFISRIDRHHDRLRRSDRVARQPRLWIERRPIRGRI